MESILQNLLPVVAAAVGGFLLARKKPVDPATLGAMLVYFISPLVSFSGVMRAEATAAAAALPAIAFVLGSVNSLLGRVWSRRVLGEGDASLLVASSASSSNTLYFGYGLATALLPPEALPLFLLASIGFSLSEAVWGFYFLARGRCGMRAAVERVARLPLFYAVAAGLVLRLAGVSHVAALAPLFDCARGAAVFTGSALLGVALARQKLRLDLRLLAAMLVSRHLTFSILAAGTIVADAAWLHLLPPGCRLLLALFATFPLANNTLTFAAALGLPTDRIGSAIVASNAVALALAPVLILLIRP
jgi:predicted permease